MVVVAARNERLFEFCLVPSCFANLTKAREEARKLEVSLRCRIFSIYCAVCSAALQSSRLRALKPGNISPLHILSLHVT